MQPREQRVRLSGELDMGSVDAARELLNAAIAGATVPTVIVDLGDVTFADSSALGMLLDAKRRADADGVDLVLANVPQQLQRILEMTSLDSILDIDETANDSARDRPESA